MLGNSSPDVIDGEVWYLEFIAIGINQFAISRLRAHQLVGQLGIDHVA